MVSVIDQWSRRGHPDNVSANPLALAAKQLNLENLRQDKPPHASIVSITAIKLTISCK